MSDKHRNKKDTLFFVISAPSGTGKTTIVKKILSEIPGFVHSVSATTRPPRKGERDGVDYHFLSREEFERKRRDGEFVEWQEVHGSLYGTLRKTVEEACSQGEDLLFDIDTQGALLMKKTYPQSRLIFFKPPSEEVLERRLRGRRTEGESALKARLDAARKEMAEQDKFDYVIINDDLEGTFQEVKKIIETERKRVSPR